MIANLLPNEATHSSLDLFEKPALLVNFDGTFCQKLGPVYSPDGPMLEFEVTVDRNNFFDLQKFFWKSNAKLSSLRELISNMMGQLLLTLLEPMLPTFCINVLHSLFSDCTVSANGLKISVSYFIETEFSHKKDAKNTWLACQGYSYEEDPNAIKAAEIARRKNLVRESAECTFYGKVALDFFTCEKHLLSGVASYCIQKIY